MNALQSIQHIADTLAGPVPAGSDAATVQKYLTAAVYTAALIEATYIEDVGSQLDMANQARAATLDRIADIAEVVSLGLANGFYLPDDPFPEFRRLNSGRRIFSPVGVTNDATAQALSGNAVLLGRLAGAWRRGEVSLERGVDPTHQLSSYEMSVDGIGSPSGDALADILGYQPDADFLKRRRALEALARLDFRRRRPRAMFVADRIENEQRTGAIVGWRKMGDASAYKVVRRALFGGSISEAIVSAEALAAGTARLREDPNVAQLLMLYDAVRPEDVVCFLDGPAPPDDIYMYSIGGIQRKASGIRAIFEGPTTALLLSAGQVETLRATLAAPDPRNFLLEGARNPYSEIAQVVFGDARYDWILAGFNFSAAGKRGDAAENVRSYSYLAARASFILDELLAGRVVVPQDLDLARRGIEESLGLYGATQTIIALLDGVGATLYVGGDTPAGFDAGTSVGLDASTDGLSRILSAIDQETATIDPSVLLSNFSFNGARGGSSRSRELGGGGQSIPSGDAIGTEPYDLATYEGISRLIRIIRFFYDFYPTAL